MYLTKQDAKHIDEAADLMTVLLQQTESIIEREFLTDTRNRLITLSLMPVQGE